MKFNIILFLRTLLLVLVQFLFFSNLYSKDAQYSYEDAYEVEKISQRFSICLYEDRLKNAKRSNELSTVIDRLFLLYARNGMYEDLFILNEKYPPNINTSNRIQKTEKIIKKISADFGIEEKDFTNVIAIAVKKNSSKQALLDAYKLTPNFHLFRYIFSIKLKLGDTETIKYLLSELPNINPIFKLAYLLKTSKEDLNKEISHYTALSDLSNQQKMDMLYFYGMYLRNIKRYRMSVRYFRMSSSFNNNKEKNIADRSTIEAAKTLILAGKSGEGCKLIENEGLAIQNESDELLDLYCKKKAIQTIKKLKPALTLLSESDNGMFFKKILQIME